MKPSGYDRVNGSSYSTQKGHKASTDAPHNDILENVGTKLKDRLIGLAGDDRLKGLGGRDRLAGKGGQDLLLGGRGLDFLNGQRGDDSLIGGLGRDSLRGEDGGDRLFGGDGRDRLLGGDGVDFLSGGLGDDLLNGGRACDLLIIGAKIGIETIQGFRSGEDLLLLRDNLSFDDLDLLQRGKDVLVAIARTEKVIAVLENVKARVLGAKDFLDARMDKDILDFADPDARGGLLDAIKAELSGLNILFKPH